MKYQLLPRSQKGILVDRMSILQDIRGTFEVSFLLPNQGAYIALFHDADGLEYRRPIRDGTCRVPKEILKKEQYISLTVCQISDEAVLWSWECEPIKVTSMAYLRKNQWALSGGMTDENCYTRLVELERLYDQALRDMQAVQDAMLEGQRQTDEAKNRIHAIEQQHTELAVKYNSAIEVINDLSARLIALEKNYDPTIIE